MKTLSREKQTQIIAALVEGNSLRATARICDVAFNTVLDFLPRVGMACAEYQDKALRGLKCKRTQCDECWSFGYAKDKNLPAEKQGKFGFGSVWTWVAVDADTKLVPSFLIGNRDAASARMFVDDLASRLASRVQLTTDGLRVYLEAIEGAFDPDPDHISTSYVERQNLSMRMGMRRFTRLTNAFSKKIENHAYMTALYFMHYNFVRRHQTLRVSPAMEAGVSERLWSVEDILNLVPQPKAGPRGPYKKRPKN
jgi:IS1 family transposase